MAVFEEEEKMTNQVPEDSHNTGGFSLFGGIRGGESNDQRVEQRDYKWLYILLAVLIIACVAIYFDNPDLFKSAMQFLGQLG